MQLNLGLVQRICAVLPAKLAILCLAGGVLAGSSTIAEASNPQAATPVFTPVGGTYTSVQSVTIKDTTKLATIYYTIDGSTPSTSSKVYSTPTTPVPPAITVSATETIKAIATAPNYSASAVGSALYTINLPKPTISSLSPSSTVANGPAFILTINGANFTSNATVKWNSTTLASGFKSTTQLLATVPSLLIASPGTFNITVTTAAGISTAVPFTVNPAKPTISSLSPNATTAGNAGFTLTVYGANFISTAVINWAQTALATTFVSTSQLSAHVSASLIAKAGTVGITVTTAGGTSAPATFNVAPQVAAQCSADGSGNGKLKGNYAFEFSQTYPTDGGGLGFLVGILTADGLGNLSGSFDSNSPYGSKSGATAGTFTGSYSIGQDDRGAMAVTVPNGSGGSQTYSYCLALDSILNGISSAGRMVETDSTSGNIASGAFYSQVSSTTTNTTKGTWVFGMQGGTVANGSLLLYRAATAGYVMLDGSGTVTAGQSDVSADETTTGSDITNQFFHQTGITGSYTLASNGRGVMTLKVPNGPGSGTSHTIFYVANANHILLMGADPSGTNHEPVMAGDAYLRTGSIFSNASLSGTSVYIDKGVSDNHSAHYDQLYQEAGIVTWDGKGNLSGANDVNNAGDVTLAPSNTFTATYSVDPNGRVVSGTSPVFYLVGPNQGLGVASGLRANLINFEKQIVPNGGFSKASLTGGYSLGTLWYGADTEPVFNGELFPDGAGNYSEALDSNTDGTVQVGVISHHTYSATATGRFLLLANSNPSYACYMVSTSKAYLMNINSGQKGVPFYVLNHQ